MQATPGFLFKDFNNFAEYEAPCRYAEELGLLKWKSDAKRLFFVTRYEQIADFMRKPKESKATTNDRGEGYSSRQK